MALVVLVALLVAGLAHASRLCGVERHATPAAAGAVRCPAHSAADVASTADAGRPPTAPPAATPHERTPSCCASGTSLATLPGARVELARDAALVTPAPAVLDTHPLLDGAQRVAQFVRAARDPGSGPRRHLVHRILLI